MNISLSDLANYAQIASIPITILTWLVTRERLAKFWKKWFVVIVPIVLITGVVGLWQKGWLRWLQFQITWPVWALILLSLSGITISLLIRVMSTLLDRTPDHFLYVADNVFGVEWHWHYLSGKLYDNNFVPYCPNRECRCQLDPQRRSGFRAIDDITLVCDHCGFTKSFDCNWEQLLWKVVKEIDRRIRTGEFREIIKRSDWR